MIERNAIQDDDDLAEAGTDEAAIDLYPRGVRSVGG